MATYDAPGVYFSETDETIQPKGIGLTGAAIVVETSIGPIGTKTLCTTPSEYTTVFGKPDATMRHEAYMSQMSAWGQLRGGQSLYVTRVVNNALYGSAILLRDPTAADTPPGNNIQLNIDPVSDTNPYAPVIAFSDDVILGIYDYSPTDTDTKIELSPNTTSSEGGFWVRVYAPSDATTPVESHLVSLTKKLNGLGQQMYIEDYINTRSKRIVVRVNTPAGPDVNGLTNVGFEDTISDSLVVTEMSQDLYGGSAGDPATPEQVLAAYQTYAGDSSIPVDLYINAGWESDILKRELLSIAAQNNAFALIDTPVSIQHDPALVTQYRNDTLNVDSSYGALIAPYLYVTDKFNAIKVHVPPSGYIGGVAAKNDLKQGKHYSFAGMEAGDLNLGGTHRDVIGVQVEYDKPAQRLFTTNQVCPILTFPGYGPRLFGDYTLQTADSMLSYINVRRMLSSIRSQVETALLFRVFNPNSVELRDKVKSRLNKILKPLLADQGLETYSIICDDSNNNRATRAAGEVYAKMELVPIGSARKFYIDATLTNDGTTTEES